MTDSLNIIQSSPTPSSSSSFTIRDFLSPSFDIKQWINSRYIEEERGGGGGNQSSNINVNSSNNVNHNHTPQNILSSILVKTQSLSNQISQQMERQSADLLNSMPK
jgi:hypothetical protein